MLRRMASASELEQGLASSALPPAVREALVSELPAWWLQRERAHVLVADLGLGHPRPASDEVRALVWPSSDPAFCRLSLAGPRERPVLLALAATVASRGLLVERAAAVTWRSGGVVYVRATLQDLDGQGLTDAGWDRLADEVKAAATGGVLPAGDYRPTDGVTVEQRPGLGTDAAVVVTAPHRPGLLWATCSELEAQGCRIEAAQTESSGDVRCSIFAVDGNVDAEALAAALRRSGSRLRPLRVLTSAAGRLPLLPPLRARR
jgi:hypothetical protein